MAARATLIVVRHGRTSWNAARRFQGQADPDLDAVGRLQARLASARIAHLVAATGPVPVVSSDLRRAQATGNVIADTLGSDLRLDGRLREIGMGAWEGLTAEGVSRRFPDEWERWTAGTLNRRGGGESKGEAAARVADALWDGMRTFPLVVAVGHGLSLQAGLEALRGEGVISLPGPAPHLVNGEILVVDAAWARPRAGLRALAS